MILTIVISVVVGLGSGALAAFIAARAQRSLSDHEAKRQAAATLRSYRRSLGDLLEHLEWVRDAHSQGNIPPINSYAKSTVAAREAAYLNAHYLDDAGRKVLEIRNVIDMHSSLFDAIDTLIEQTETLDKSIAKAFKPGT
jgi:hypothetical protein